MVPQFWKLEVGVPSGLVPSEGGDTDCPMTLLQLLLVYWTPVAFLGLEMHRQTSPTIFTRLAP